MIGIRIRIRIRDAMSSLLFSTSPCFQFVAKPTPKILGQLILRCLRRNILAYNFISSIGSKDVRLRFWSSDHSSTIKTVNITVTPISRVTTSSQRIVFTGNSASLFGVSPIEANATDPQARLSLETVYEAIDADSQTIEGLQGSNTGCYVGLMCGDYEQVINRESDSMAN